MCPLSSCVGSRLPSKPHPPKRNTWSFVLCLLSFSAASLLSIVLPCGFETSFGTSPTEAEHLVLCPLSFVFQRSESIVYCPPLWVRDFLRNLTHRSGTLGPLSIVFQRSESIVYCPPLWVRDFLRNLTHRSGTLGPWSFVLCLLSIVFQRSDSIVLSLSNFEAQRAKKWS